jgi:hypothetical protein
VFEILNVNPADILGGLTDGIGAVLFDDRLHGLMRRYDGGNRGPLPRALVLGPSHSPEGNHL